MVEYEKEQADTVKMFNKDLNAELLLQQKINNKELEGAQLKKANKYLRNLQNDLEYQSYKTSIMAVNKAKEEVAIMQERIEEEKRRKQEEYNKKVYEAERKEAERIRKLELIEENKRIEFQFHKLLLKRIFRN